MEQVPNTLPNTLRNFPKSLVTMYLLLILLSTLSSGDVSAHGGTDINNLTLYPSQSISLERYNLNASLNVTLANAMRYVSGSLDRSIFEENMNRIMSYTTADEAVNDSFALNFATVSAFNNLMFSEEFEEFRNNNDISSVDKLVEAVLHLTISLDFDRSINDAVLEVNPETGVYEVVGTEIGGAQQAYINQLQVKLVAGRWVYHRNKILEAYGNDINIVRNGELTDTGKMMALIEFANWSNIFRVISDVAVFTDPNITFQIITLINSEDDNENLNLMIIQLSSDPESYLMIDYNVFYPGSELYNYLLAIASGEIKPHKGIKALIYHSNGGIEVYYDMNYKEEIRLGFSNQSNIANYYLNSGSYLSRLSDFQREKLSTSANSNAVETHPSLEHSEQ